MTPKIRIDVWSDYVCPFCYLEEPVLERIRHEYGDTIGVEWRAFELRPEPFPTLDPDGEYLHRVWNQSVYPMARQRGMTLKLPPVQPRSRRAFELAEFAREHGRFDEVHHALFRAFFEDGRNLADIDVLLDIAVASDLSADAVRASLEQGRFLDRVLADQRDAHALGVSGVPAAAVRRAGAALADATLISGAQPYEYVKAEIERVLEQ